MENIPIITLPAKLLGEIVSRLDHESPITLETADSFIDFGLIPNVEGIITFQTKIEGLLPNTKYYIKIFAKIDKFSKIWIEIIFICGF